jgi:acyl carrier protein
MQLMSTVEERLLQSFRIVFPGESDSALRHATPETIAQWDSTTHFTLLQVIEEEFDIRIPESVSGEILSFDDFQEYLKSHSKPDD